MRRSGRTIAELAALLCVCGALTAVSPEDRGEVVPGRLVIDPPTLENLGFRWYIEGDDNRNASVAVSYRIGGDGDWKEALPMLRVHHEVANQAYGPYRTGNLFAGSVLSLKPDTKYEVRLAMRDPDGGAPEPRVVSVATRAEPGAFDEGNLVQVVPRGFDGKRPEGAVEGFQAALDVAGPGHILLLTAGTYKGPFVLERSGWPDRPIVVRGIDGGAVLEGPDLRTDLLEVSSAKHVVLEGLTFRKARTAIRAGRKNARGASHLVVRRCRIEEVIRGINTESEESTDWYIADNVLTGINPTWYPRPDEGYMEPSHTGINVYGRGHVVCHNRITRFSDSLAIANFGPPVEDVEKHCVAIDFYNNDLSFAQDDCLETDYGCHNIRVYRNRCYNAHTGLSVQPSYGGPIYLIRNEVYGVTALPLKLHNYCTGLEVYNNTVCCAGPGFRSFNRWQNGHFRNNLILGGRPRTDRRGSVRTAYAMATGTITPYSTLDYNGYRRNGPGDLIRWYDGKADATYASLADFARATGHERHGIMVDYDTFEKAAPPEAGVASDPRQYDLRLKAAGAAVDRGCSLPTVTDDHAGEASDLGCYELGSPLPHYGPRPEK